MSFAFILARFDRQIELVRVPRHTQPRVGGEFECRPRDEIESWTIVKVFEGTEERHLDALLTLVGMPALNKLFALELPQHKSYEQAFTETVSRMGGET